MAKGKKSQRRDDRKGTKRVAAAPERKRAAKTRAPKTRTTFNFGSSELIFDRFNYIVMGGGLALIVAGLIAMTGGAMEDPNVWDESVIYSSRRITLAPILMLTGFAVVGYGIFASQNSASEEAATGE